jgi:polysaccharide deacetylase 2 family uncharacterized protein YibQ
MSVEVYHNSRKEHASSFQYRILIDKNSIIENEDKNPQSVSQEEEKPNVEAELYERTKYGYLPKISKSGVSVFNEYSASSESGSWKMVRVAVLVDDIDQTNSAVKLVSQKITFIVPHYIDNLENVVKIIRENGHEFFIQMPTQSSISANKKETVSPFLANANIDTTLDKLFYLLASTKYAIGVANVSPTLLTKSKKDMAAIAGVLAQRGLAFVDIEKSNDLLQGVAKKSSLIYIRATNAFESDGVTKLEDGDIVVIRSTNLKSFIKILPENWLLSPVSVSVRRQP